MPVFFGKLMGVLLGFPLGPVGIVLGLLVGHLVDTMVPLFQSRLDFHRQEESLVPPLFELLGAVAHKLQPLSPLQGAYLQNRIQSLGISSLEAGAAERSFHRTLREGGDPRSIAQRIAREFRPGLPLRQWIWETCRGLMELSPFPRPDLVPQLLGIAQEFRLMPQGAYRQSPFWEEDEQPDPGERRGPRSGFGPGMNTGFGTGFRESQSRGPGAGPQGASGGNYQSRSQYSQAQREQQYRDFFEELFRRAAGAQGQQGPGGGGRSQSQQRSSAGLRPRQMDPATAFRTLELSPGAPEAEVKKKYREFVRKLHPDSLSPDLPESERKSIQERFLKIQEAYDTIRREK